MTIAPPEDTVQALLEATRALVAVKTAEAKQAAKGEPAPILTAAEAAALSFAEKLAAVMPETDDDEPTPGETLAAHLAARTPDLEGDR